VLTFLRITAEFRDIFNRMRTMASIKSVLHCVNDGMIYFPILL